MPGSLKWFLSSDFVTKTTYAPLFFPIRATSSAYLSLLYFIARKIFGEECRAWSSSLCCLFHSSVYPSLLGPNILSSTPFSKPSAYIPSSVWASSFHTHSNNGKIIVLYILIFIYVIVNRSTEPAAGNDRNHSLTSNCS
jgi:hypothetical protein